MKNRVDVGLETFGAMMNLCKVKNEKLGVRGIGEDKAEKFLNLRVYRFSSQWPGLQWWGNEKWEAELMYEKIWTIDWIKMLEVIWTKSA